MTAALIQSVISIGSTPGEEGPASAVAAGIMTAPAVTCREEALFGEIAKTLADRDISGMPVVDSSGRVVGVISERDLAHALGGPLVRLALRRRTHGLLRRVISQLPMGPRCAKDIMTSPPITTDRDASLRDVARLMRVHQINRLPVMEGDKVLGVVTRGDVLSAIAHIGSNPIDLTKPTVQNRLM
jgi:CBS domain-containing protein